MARFMWFAVICVLLPLAAAIETPPQPYYIEGGVYCDTCRFGFETVATTYIPGAKVKIVCNDRANLKATFVTEGVTGSDGRYRIQVHGDRQDQMCSAFLVSSPTEGCKTQDPGRNRATVILTGANGAGSNRHFANNMGFLKDEALPLCGALRKQYFADGDLKTI